MDTYTYRIGNSLYVNVTNSCTNNCTFCVRDTSQGLEDRSLWIKRTPTPNEILAGINNPEQYEEFVFCGYGEPLTELKVVVETAKLLRRYNKPIRINTNGHANLIHGRNIVPELEGLIDVISISLNAEDPETYQRVSKSVYGEDAYNAVLDFAKECKNFIPKVILSVVDMPEIDVEKSRDIAESIGVEFRVRHWSPNL